MKLRLENKTPDIIFIWSHWDSNGAMGPNTEITCRSQIDLNYRQLDQVGFE